MPVWNVYLVRCRDGSLYCGIATSVVRRVAEHNAGKGAKYIVPSRRPAVCVWKRRVRDQSEALRLEYWLKRRDADTKAALTEKRAALKRQGSRDWRIAPARPPVPRP
jgi:putative endonuclease